ncbi:MAG: flagellar hook-basal body protein [Campylobacterales bacterium]|nr:flagellar hook-basal body protein [Campylobacterales bacterium]NQY52950.1 flagellar hook-basal body protein [Campylobacteraceae bacterium]
MNQGTYPLAAAMINQINRLDVIANNLANVNTNAFKQEGLSQGTFNNYLSKAEKNSSSTLRESEITNIIPKIDKKYISSSMGSIETTGNALDFALNQKDTFFKVQNEDGDILYTRDGAFKNSFNNFLVNGNGDYILNNDNEPISTEDRYIDMISVSKIDYSNLDKFGNNSYKIIDNEQIEVMDSNDGLILQGSLEKSNVNMVTAMVTLIEAHKSFAQSQKAISTIDEINGKLIEKLGRMT